MVILILVVILVKWRGSSGNRRPEERRKPASHQSTQFHAVSLKLARNACDAARAMEGRRFLSNAAPRIPLPDCDAAECNCRFVHHKDRRSGEDRRDPSVAAPNPDATSRNDERVANAGTIRRKTCSDKKKAAEMRRGLYSSRSGVSSGRRQSFPRTLQAAARRLRAPRRVRQSPPPAGPSLQTVPSARPAT